MRSGLVLVIGLAALSGCSSSNPAAIQEHTADATAAAKRDAGAIARGVVEGLQRKGPLDLNTASKEQLQTLPDVDSSTADSIISHRPYTEISQLLRRHIVSQAVFEKIRPRVFIGK